MSFLATLAAVVLGNYIYDAWLKYDDKDGDKDV